MVPKLWEFMTSRDKILQSIGTSGIPDAPPPLYMPVKTNPEKNLQELFADMVRRVGGDARILEKSEQISGALNSDYPGIHRIISCVDGLPYGNLKTVSDEPPQLVLLRAELGVAENGAVWLSDRDLPQRILPFIAENVLILLQIDGLVADMHAAYSAIGRMDYSFGLFLSGPSKTADIEQSLVIGAQGAKSLRVYLHR